MAKITRALISVSDKTGIVEFSRQLAGFGVEILSTGGTAKLLREAGLTVKDVSEFTGFPEMLDGRVKTLHPKVHGGLLGMRGNPEHVATMKAHGIEPIDMVVVNLYPFEATVAKPECTLEDAIENIDIGGPTMLRSAAKNNADVTVIVDHADYGKVLDEMKSSDGSVAKETNFGLAVKVYQHTAAYDGAISNWLGKKLGPENAEFPPTLTFQFKKAQGMRYGENPHLHPGTGRRARQADRRPPVRGGDHRPPGYPRSGGDRRRQEERAPPFVRGMAGRARPAARHEEGERRPPGPGHRSPPLRGAEGGDQKGADREGDGGPPVYLAGRQVRQVECDRLRQGRHDHRRRRRPDEPGQLRPDRRHQSGACRPRCQGGGNGLRCLFPFPRRP